MISSLAIVLALFLVAVGISYLLFRLIFKDYNNQ